MTIQRTGDTSGCTAWPQSAFGGSWGVQVPLTADQQTACLAIGADQHSTAELFDFTNTTNQLNASVQVYDSAGDKVCATLGSSTTTCTFTPGTAYAALLVGTGAADTYKLVRRDISATASCPLRHRSPSAVLPSPIRSRPRWTAAACASLRRPRTDCGCPCARRRPPTAPALALGVADASGKVVCRQQGVLPAAPPARRRTSSIVLASGYDGAPIAAHVDTWRIGTASGWAPQCTAHTVSPDGFAVRSGTLTESATAYCAVIHMQPSQRFEVYGTDSSTSADTPWVSLLSNTSSSGSGIDSNYQCRGQRRRLQLLVSDQCLAPPPASTAGGHPGPGANARRVLDAGRLPAGMLHPAEAGHSDIGESGERTDRDRGPGGRSTART